MVLRPPEFHPLPASDPSTFALTVIQSARPLSGLTIRFAAPLVSSLTGRAPPKIAADKPNTPSFNSFNSWDFSPWRLIEEVLLRSRRYGSCLHSESWVLSPPACCFPAGSASSVCPTSPLRFYRRSPASTSRQGAAVVRKTPDHHGVLWESLPGLSKLSHATHQGTLSRLNRAKGSRMTSISLIADNSFS